MAKKDKKSKKKGQKACEEHACDCGCGHECTCHDDACDCDADGWAAGLTPEERAVWDVLDAVPAVDAFARLADECWRAGWGAGADWALTCVLSEDEAASALPHLGEGGDACPIAPGALSEDAAARVAGRLVLVSAAGALMRNVATDVPRTVGIVRVSDDAASACVVWSLVDGGAPTPALSLHLACHALASAPRVVLSAPAPAATALTYVLPLDDRAFTRVLWKAQAQCCTAIPGGVGVVADAACGAGDGAFCAQVAGKAAPGGVAVLAHRGLVVTGAGFDDVLRRVSCVEAAAGIYRDARVMNGGSDVFRQTISDARLRQIASASGVVLREEFLN